MPTVISAEEMDAIGRRFIDAFNRRDAEALIALADRAIDFRPTPLVGSKRTYLGHDGLREWVADLINSQANHQVRVREVRPNDATSFLLLLSEVLLEGDVVSPSAMHADLNAEALIVAARAYLSSEETLRAIDALPDP